MIMNVPLAQSIVSFHKLAGIPCKYKISPNDQQCHICDFSLSLHIHVVKNDPYTTKLASKLDCHFIVMVTKIIDAQLKVHKLENVSVKIWSDVQPSKAAKINISAYKTNIASFINIKKF